MKQKGVAVKGPWVVGHNYFIRTVTMALMGKLVGVGENELVLKDASWIADTGRYMNFLENKPTSSLEVEPYPEGLDVIVGRGGVIDAVEWKYPLLRSQK